MTGPSSERKKAPPQLAAPTPEAAEQVEAPEHEPPTSVPALAGLASGPPSDPLGGTTASHDVTAALRRRQGRGQALPTDVAQNFGDRLGADLSGVRVHADGEADTIAKSVQATAFTHGSDVYFAKGAYQ